MEDQTVVRFRVGRNIRKGLVRVTLDGAEAFRRKRPVMAPGEMEQVTLRKEWFAGGPKAIEVWAGEEEEAK